MLLREGCNGMAKNMDLCNPGHGNVCSIHWHNAQGQLHTHARELQQNPKINPLTNAGSGAGLRASAIFRCSVEHVNALEPEVHKHKIVRHTCAITVAGSAKL